MQNLILRTKLLIGTHGGLELYVLLDPRRVRVFGGDWGHCFRLRVLFHDAHSLLMSGIVTATFATAISTFA